MSNRCRTWTWFLVALLLTAIAAPAWAQKPKAKAPAADDAAPVAKKKAAAKAEAADAKQTEMPQFVEPEDQAVQALLDTNPSTPPEWLQVAKTLIRLEKPKLAKGFLQKVVAAKPDPRQLAALAEQLGADFFLQLASREDLAPEGKQLADAVALANESQARDPQRLAGLVKQLQDPSAETRFQAVLGLQQAQRMAVGPLLAVLADPNRAAEYPNVRAALVRLGKDAVRPLTAVLECPHPKLVTEAIRALTDMDSRSSVVHLLALATSRQSSAEVRAAAQAGLLKLAGRAPIASEAAYTLAQQAQQYFDGRQPIQEDSPGLAELWFWDETQKQPVPRTCTVEDAVRIQAYRFARDAHRAAPDDAAIRLLYLATLLERAAVENGLDKPLPSDPGTPAAVATAFGPEVIEAVMQYAIARHRVPAATAAARILGQIPTAERLLYQGSQAAPLVQAVRHSDARLRMAAVEAILALKPMRPFPGSTFVTESLGFFLSCHGSRRVLVANAVTAEARRLGGYLSALGYQVSTATTGREALRMAMTSTDFELLLLDSGLDLPTVDLLLPQLRRDFRTAALPVGIVARDGQWERATRLAKVDPLAEAFPRLHAEEPMRREVERLLILNARKMVPLAERRQQAAWAMRQLVALSTAAPQVFDLARLQEPLLEALKVPELSAEAASVLGALGTPASQQALVDLASRFTQPLEARKAALAAFRQNTEKHGILLTTSQVSLQYERYNQSQTLDTATQQVLGLLLDCIEAPSRAAKEARRAGGAEAKVDLRSVSQ